MCKCECKCKCECQHHIPGNEEEAEEVEEDEEAIQAIRSFTAFFHLSSEKIFIVKKGRMKKGGEKAVR
jgi:hypothetical protein